VFLLRLKHLLLAVCAVGLLGGTSHVKPKKGEPLANQLFGAAKTGSEQKSRVFGYYAAGCVAGAMELPETGPTWQAMRLSRNRNWGHPELVDFLITLSGKVTEFGWKGLYVGDMSQPRGGPMTSGHSSHQNGLDADIWMLPPTRLNLTPAERENLSSIDIRTKDKKGLTKNWTPSHMQVIKAAALDKRVERIFVTAAAKIYMCNQATGDRRWLSKVRPLFGHNYHFHVRLKCPKGSPICRKQTPVSKISKGDGCDKSLTWWVTDYLNPPKVDPNKKKTKKKKPPPPKRRARQMIMADLPQQCRKVLKSR